MTIPNLLNFIIANLEGDSHVEALVNVCHLGSGEPPKDCVARTRRICLDIIENLLHGYRKIRRDRDVVCKITASNKRRKILLKLEHIRDIHLILSSVDNLMTDHRAFQQISHKFKVYYKNLVALDKRNSKVRTVRKAERKEKIIAKQDNIRDEL